MTREMSAEARARQISGLRSGRKSTYKRNAKLSNAEYARQYGQEVIDHLMEIVRHGEPDAARILAGNSILDRGFGKPINSDGGNAGGPRIVNVITGVREGSTHPSWGQDPPRPLLPDGRDPFEKHGGSMLRDSNLGRPVRNAPVAEPPSTVRLTEGAVAPSAPLTK